MVANLKGANLESGIKTTLISALKYNKKLDIPHIDEDLIRMVFKSLIKESQGPKPKGTNLNYYNEFNDFFNFQPLHLAPVLPIRTCFFYLKFL